MIIIFKLILTVAVITSLTTYIGMKLVEWCECRK